MKIVELKAENYKRLEAVEIRPDGNMVILSGANDQGKSSVLDAIQAAIAGGRGTRDTPEPIHRGKDRAEVSLDLGDLRIRRIWEPGKNRVEVTNAEGSKFSSPQGILDALTGSLTFDPLEFARMQPKEQRAALLRLVTLPFDVDETDRQRTELVQIETAARQDAKRAEQAVSALPSVPDDTPDVETPAASLFDELNKLKDQKRTNDKMRYETDTAYEQYQEAVERTDRLRKQFESIKEELESSVTAKESRYKAWESLKAVSGKLFDPDTSEVEDKIAKLDETNNNVRQKKANAEARAALQSARGAADIAKNAVASHDSTRRDALAAAKFPIDGLGFDDVGVTLNGLPFAQASESQRIKTSVAVGMAMNPKLRVMLVRDGSLLDSKRMADLAEMAKDGGWQLWVEKVDETGAVGIVIEDGKIREEVK